MQKIPCVIVLCRPEESRNIGSVCRAMKNMGCYTLRIVGKAEDYSDPQVRTLALHAADIWESAQFYPPDAQGLAQAISDCTIAAGTTRRMGQKRKSWGMTPEQFAELTLNAGESTFAAVFGNERTGLTDEELNCCSLALNIPSNDDFPSLNLSHAVQIVTYALFRTRDNRKRGYNHIPLAQVQDLVATISGHMDRIGIYTHAGKEENERFLEGIFARAALSGNEARHIEKLFRKMAYIRCNHEQQQ
ncbi:MAG: putative tRNA/rRNA methyltransferase [Spirochaetes bacterium ADurb.Bin269]|nr:MAG: putative tRNA/rRNA methyltransferase [Spirochaetes bacterium ADurb.Bin269]